MPRSSTNATCQLCGNTYRASGMTRHLQACLPKHLDQLQRGPSGMRAQKAFFVAVQGYGMADDYWLHLGISANARLQDLDAFLRAIWLECCGHLSCFTISDLRYDVYPFELSDHDMNRRLDAVLTPGLAFSYEYDFGTTSYLDLRVVDEVELAGPKAKIQVLARNEPPAIPCQVCGEAQAAWICPFCIYEEEGWLCEACAGTHTCGEDILLPVVNSPRTGLCGYEGPAAAAPR